MCGRVGFAQHVNWFFLFRRLAALEVAACQQVNRWAFTSIGALLRPRQVCLAVCYVVIYVFEALCDCQLVRQTQPG